MPESTRPKVSCPDRGTQQTDLAALEAVAATPKAHPHFSHASANGCAQYGGGCKVWYSPRCTEGGRSVASATEHWAALARTSRNAGTDTAIFKTGNPSKD